MLYVFLRLSVYMFNLDPPSKIFVSDLNSSSNGDPPISVPNALDSSSVPKDLPFVYVLPLVHDFLSNSKMEISAASSGLLASYQRKYGE